MSRMVFAPEVLTMVIEVAIAAIVAAVVAAVVAGRKSRRRELDSEHRRPERDAPEKWSAVVDHRGLVVEAKGPADRALLAYLVQAAKALEEVGGLVELRARLGDVTVTLLPSEKDLYRVVAR